MCVAAVIERDLSLEDLKKMASANPDGGGIAYPDGDTIAYRKGLTAEEVHALQQYLPRPYFVHFRIATKGAKIPELTHPFPIGMQAFSDDLVGFARAVLMHNGTWNDYDRYVPAGIKRTEVSDTQVAAYACAFDEDLLNKVGWSNAIMRAAGDGRADITLRGQWSEHEGNQFSNLHWRREYTYGNYSYTDRSREANLESYWCDNCKTAGWAHEQWCLHHPKWEARKPARVALPPGRVVHSTSEDVTTDVEREARGRVKREKIARKEAKRDRRQERLKERTKALLTEPDDLPCDECGSIQGHYNICPFAGTDGDPGARDTVVDLVDIMERGGKGSRLRDGDEVERAIVELMIEVE